ncbi:MAG: DUF2258 domain-containing protein [Fervidicoccaceae archaeon]|jgi:hypothetical protein|nr:DUF2258 domain-containing protein [Fervidicoccaceae archaeon]MCC6052144.1 DUF2258 domain-containing protein [Fervidicoccaceae archaeon]
MSVEGEQQLPNEISFKTGPVRASGYAIKLRRVVNAALREHYKSKVLNPKKVNEYVTNLNKTLYQILIDRLGVPKDLVVDISGKIVTSGDSIQIKDVEITLWDKDELLSRSVTKELREKIEKPA